MHNVNSQAINESNPAYFLICKSRDESLADIDKQSKKSNTEIIIGSFCVILYPVCSQKKF